MQTTSSPPPIQERLQEVVRRIVEAYAPQRIILFGSHAYGRPDGDSDVDLLIVMASDERPAARAARISRLLRPRPFPMDIMVRTPEEVHHRLSIHDPFIGEIMDRGKVLYEQNPGERMGPQS